MSGAMPFTLNEVAELASILRDVCIGLVELAYPDTRPSAWVNASKAARDPPTDSRQQQDVRLWMHLFKSTVNLARQLHTRDTRRQFCSTSVWVTGRVALPLERNGQLSLRRQGRTHRPFRVIRSMTRSELGSSCYSIMIRRNNG